MKAFKYLLLLILIGIIGFSIYIAVQPNSFSVTRTKVINAPQSVIYNNVIDFKNWEAWSSWVEENPETKITLPEKTKGIGGSYSWEDNDGIGSMTTIATTPKKTILQEMQFNAFPKSEVSWQFKSLDNSSTEVTWTISGKNLPFDFKLVSTIMGGMETQIGPHFKRGLVKLDSVLQEEMKVYSVNINGVTAHSGGYYLFNSASCKLSEFEKTMKEMLPKVGTYALTHNITMAGPPFVLYHKWDEENDAVIFSCGVPTNSKISTEDPEILTGQLNSFKCIKTTLTGDYKNLKEAWKKSMAYAEANNLLLLEGGPMLETYVTDPMLEPNPAHWITEIYIAIK